MRVFKKNISAYKVLLCTSILINLLFVKMVILAEKQSHVFTRVLERKGIITLDDKSYPDYWARVGWENTIKKLNTEFDIAFFGNSITNGSDFQSFFTDKKIINLGYPGDNINGMTKRVSMLKAAHPKKIFIMGGTNDLFSINVDEFEERYNNLLTAIFDSIPDTEIFLESILPMNQDLRPDAPSDEKIRQANNRLQKIASERNLQYIDIYSSYVKNGKLPEDLTKDGVHLYPQNYNKWAEKIMPFIDEH